MEKKKKTWLKPYSGKTQFATELEIEYYEQNKSKLIFIPETRVIENKVKKGSFAFIPIFKKQTFIHI